MKVSTYSWERMVRSRRCVVRDAVGIHHVCVKYTRDGVWHRLCLDSAPDRCAALRFEEDVWSGVAARQDNVVTCLWCVAVEDEYGTTQD